MLPYKYITNFEESGERLPPREIIFSRVMEKLILDEILLQKAKKFGVRISDQELNEALSRFAEKDGLSLQDFRKKIENEGKQFKGFRETVKKELILRRVQGGLVRPKIIISDQELMNYINSSEGQSLITIEYKINQILVKGDNRALRNGPADCLKWAFCINRNTSESYPLPKQLAKRKLKNIA